MFVADESARVVVFTRPDGTIGELPEGAFRAWRNELPADEAAAVNSIWFASQLSAARYAALADSLVRVLVNQPGPVAQLSLGLGSYSLLLAHQLIVKWDGPAFAGAPLSPATIDRLDGDAPLVTALFRALTRRFGPDTNGFLTTLTASAGELRRLRQQQQDDEGTDLAC